MMEAKAVYGVADKPAHEAEERACRRVRQNENEWGGELQSAQLSQEGWRRD
mgnify:CR=1 FL=1